MFKNFIFLFQEEAANINLQKYRQMQVQLDNAEERADVAENSLIRMRSQARISKSQTLPSF